MTHLEKMDEFLDKTQRNAGKAYEELVAIVKEQGGEIDFGEKTIDFAWLKNEGFERVLKAKQLKRIRIADCAWNGELEVLFEGEDANDECAWVSLDWCSDFIEFNLYGIYDRIKQNN